jgi:hypothetical protein
MQHSCVKGAYKPWTSTLQSYPGEDCIETNGPDCEVPISQNPHACRNKNLCPLVPCKCQGFGLEVYYTINGECEVIFSCVIYSPQFILLYKCNLPETCADN